MSRLVQLDSPFPGRVVKVAKGDLLFLLEAMKMETSVTAALAGVVKEILVKSGDTVESGDLLLAYQ